MFDFGVKLKINQKTADFFAGLKILDYASIIRSVHEFLRIF